jgi:penicillin-binding protein-related factor A (putative recombinase)
MKEFIESSIRFEFDERNWDICQYDASSSDFRNKVHLSETKAVDFIGVYNNKTLILFEIKSFKGFGNQLSVQNRLLNSMD